jgi:hypothetical protein
MKISRSATSRSYSLGGLDISIASSRRTSTPDNIHPIERKGMIQLRDYVLEISTKILGYYVRFCFQYIYGSISCTIQVDPVADILAPIFYLCLDGKVSDVKSIVKSTRGITFCERSFRSHPSTCELPIPIMRRITKWW